MAAKIVSIGLIVGTLVGLIATSPDRTAQDKMSKTAALAKAKDPALKTILQRQRDGHFYVDALVNDNLVHFLVDTGASSIALTPDDARAVGIDVDPGKFEIVGRGASGDVTGQIVNVHHIAIGQKEAWNLTSVVLADATDVSLLGQSYLAQIGSVSIENDRMTLY